MSDYFGSSLGKHKRILVLVIAATVLAVYMLPLDQLSVLAGKSAGSVLLGNAKKGGGNDCGNDNKQGNNNDQGEDHYGCLKHL